MSKTLPPPQVSSWSFNADEMERYAYCDSFMTPKECKDLIAFAKKHPLTVGTLGTEGKTNTKLRKSEVVFLSPIGVEWLYRRLTDSILALNSQYFKFDLFGFTEGLQFTEYKAPGGKYDAHVDIVYKGVIRKLSIVIQLTDEKSYTGGELQLLHNGESSPWNLPRKQGTLLIFPSFLLHRVTPVTKGTRNSLVGWISGKPFK